MRNPRKFLLKNSLLQRSMNGKKPDMQVVLSTGSHSLINGTGYILPWGIMV
jgi:hypothetical protein